MSKVLEALERAEREKQEPPSQPVQPIERPSEEPVEPENLLEDLVEAKISVRVQKGPQDGLSPLLVSHFRPESMVAEQFRRIRTRIFHHDQGASLKTIMVTSAMANEGKSLVAANLAISIAQGLQEHVLLVEADIRHPMMHKYFGFSRRSGLADYLNTEVALSDIFIKSGITKLTVIPGGRPKINPVELISSKKMVELVQELKERYDDRYILFDCTPLTWTNEPNILEKEMDGVLLVVKHNCTPRDFVKKALSALTPEKVLGTILNDVSFDMPGYYKKYYYEDTYR